jgi:hypothetical protein
MTGTMKLGVMQPYLFPYVGYFQLIEAVDHFVFYDDVNYIKQGWINRNRIRSGADEVTFTVPLAGASSQKQINETLVDPVKWSIWREKFLRTITQSYSRAPFFDDSMDLILGVLKERPITIADLAIRSVSNILDHYGSKMHCVRSSLVYPRGTTSGEMRLIEIAEQAGATKYVNMVGGSELYHADTWGGNGMSLHFLKPTLRPYGPERSWIPGLSIIDVMMYVPLEEMRETQWQGEVIAAGERAAGRPGTNAENILPTT